MVLRPGQQILLMATITISVPVVGLEWLGPPSLHLVTSVSSRSLQAVLNRLSLPVRRATSKLPACNRDVEARTRAKTSESAGQGPGNPSDPEGPCRRRHGCCWPCAGRQAPASRWRAPQFCIQQTDTIYRVFSASTLVVVVIGCGLTPVKILFRLRLQKFIPGVIPQPLVRVEARDSTTKH